MKKKYAIPKSIMAMTAAIFLTIGAASFGAAAESTGQSEGFVIIEDPADLSDVPGCEGIDILTVTVSETDGERVYFNIKMNGDVASTPTHYYADGIYLLFNIDNTNIEIYVCIRPPPVYDNQGADVQQGPPDTEVWIEGDTLKISTPYKSLSGIHVGSVLSKSWAFTRPLPALSIRGDIAPGGTHSGGYPVPESYGKDYIVTMGPKIELTADALEKSVKVGDEVQFRIGLTNTGPAATIAVKGKASEIGWDHDFEPRSIAVGEKATEYVLLTIRPPLDGVAGDSTAFTVVARGNTLDLAVTLTESKTDRVGAPGETIDPGEIDPGTPGTDGGGTPGFGAVSLLSAGALACAVGCLWRRKKKET